MRIIAGTRRGLRLISPPGRVTRPITDRVKESVFNILANYGLPEGTVVADLFCGTGSLGLEALSRGAQWVNFFDNNRKTLEILKKNIQRAGFEQRCKAIFANVFSVGAASSPQWGLYDIVFVDPPYRYSENASGGTRLADLMALISQQVQAGGWVLLRSSSKAVIEPVYGQLNQTDQRRWGTMMVSFYRKSPIETKTELSSESIQQEEHYGSWGTADPTVESA